MRNYWLCFVGADGEIARVVEFTAYDDEDAVFQSSALADGRDTQLWHWGRRVKAYCAEESRVGLRA
jgi:hypothetical protein